VTKLIPLGSSFDQVVISLISLGSTFRSGGRSRAKVNVLPDSHKLLVTPNLEFERQFGWKTVLSGLRLKKK
jgi:hypothetical protein